MFWINNVWADNVSTNNVWTDNVSKQIMFGQIIFRTNNVWTDNIFRTNILRNTSHNAEMLHTTRNILSDQSLECVCVTRTVVLERLVNTSHYIILAILLNLALRLSFLRRQWREMPCSNICVQCLKTLLHNPSGSITTEFSQYRYSLLLFVTDSAKIIGSWIP